MAASPQSSPQPAATPEPAAIHCPHLAAALADASDAAPILAKYRAVVAWTVHRAQELRQPAKRRKARACGLRWRR